MYVICYTKLNGSPKWEIVDGFDEMQVRVSELCDELGCDVNDILVFDKDDELN